MVTYLSSRVLRRPKYFSSTPTISNKMSTCVSNAKRLTELRTDFVSAVSHELRTPIAPLRILAELLDQGKIEPENLKEIYVAMARESERLSNTVQRLLGFGRKSRGRLAVSVTEALAATKETTRSWSSALRYSGARGTIGSISCGYDSVRVFGHRGREFPKIEESP